MRFPTAMRRHALSLGLSLLGLLFLAGIFAVVALANRTASYRVNGFRFDGPVGLEDLAVALGEEEAWGRKDPRFVVRPLSDEGIDWALEPGSDDTRVGDLAARLRESETFAPLRGGRDHSILVYVPELGAGISLYFRTHERDHGATTYDRIDAWWCRRWARVIVGSLEWEGSGLRPALTR